MHWLDKQFLTHKKQYVGQCFLATMVIFMVLLILDKVANAAIIASLGASTFILFTMPGVESSRPRFLIGGYSVGIISGCVCYFLSTLPFVIHTPLLHEYATELFSALAVGLAIFVMVVIDTEHPPAAGVALGLVFNECNTKTVLVVFLGIVSLVVLQKVFRPMLRNLL